MPTDPIQAIEAAERDVREARRRLDLAVAIAADAGHSFAEIGKAARMTRQAARQRWTEETRAAVLAEARAARITITYRDGRIERHTETDADEIRRLENLAFTDPDQVVLTKVEIPAPPGWDEEAD
ncbi:hypothetical protein [Nocardioides sp.]|uniref:hypothetical protein n=1 Tax=Nocardioides sp. TaxID=35761 RepID=UPI0019C34C75|nr:hypothetical protein [Nocardioides sp.]MBC7279216.1 hypothetical protein [Nocardioides sp.]